MPSATFLLQRNPIIARLFTGQPWLIFFWLAVPGLVLIFLSFPFGVDSIAGTNLEGKEVNVGIFWRWNWSLMYPFILPAIFLACFRLSERIESSVRELESAKIISPGDGTKNSSFLDSLGARLNANAQGLVMVCMSLMLLLTYVDTIDLTAGYYTYKKSQDLNSDVDVTSGSQYIFAEEDWSVAFQAKGWKKIRVNDAYSPPSRNANLLFNGLAYCVQALAIFFGLFWVGKVGQFFVFLSRLFLDVGQRFKINPIPEDPLKRLGLASLGSIFNIFLSVILVFEVYVVAHRIQQVGLATGTSSWSYVRELVEAATTPREWFEPGTHRFSTIDGGTWLLIFAIALPFILVCWMPLFRIRRHVQDRKLQLSNEYAFKRTQAQDLGEKAEVEEYSKKIKLLDQSSVWPNGDKVAQRFLVLMIVFWIGAIVPILLISLIVGVFVPEIVSALKKIMSRS